MSTTYRADIDGLRAVAVLAVVGHHAFPRLIQSGFVGVDVFFVISGFLISGNISADLSRGTFSFADFYARRIRRIFPALVLVLIACSAIGWAVLFANEFRELGKHVAAGAGFVSNLALQSEAGYFGYAADTQPLLHLWSLGIEEQFYIVWPLLLWLVWARFNQRTVMSILVLASFSASIYASWHHPVAAFYFPLFRVWELACGGLLAVAVSPATVAQPAWRRSLIGVTGLALIATASFVAVDQNTFPGWWALLPTGGAWLVIAAGPQGLINRILSIRPLVWIGLISYPLYLWHWPLLTFARILDGPLPSRAVRGVMVVASFLLAWLTYRAIEKPLRRPVYGGRVAMALSACMTLVAAQGFITYASDGLPSRSVARRAHAYVASMVATPRSADCYDIDRAHDRVSSWFCELNPAGPAPSGFVFGDSHGRSLLPAFERAAIARGQNLLFTGYSGCPPLLGIESVRGDQDVRNCRALNERVFRFVVDSNIADLYLVSAWTYYTDGDYSGENYNLLASEGTPHTLAGSRLAFERGLDETLARYGASGVRLHFVGKVPSQLRSANDLVRTLVTGGPESVERIRAISVPLQRHRQLMAYVSAQFERRQIRDDRRAAASLIDLDPVFCANGACAFARPGTSFYLDNSHLTIEGAQLAAPTLAQHLAER